MVDYLDFSFKGINAIDKNFITLNINNPILAEQERKVIDISQTNGLVQLSKKFTKRIIPIRGMLHGVSYADLVEKFENFATFIFSEEHEQLILNEQPTKYYLVQQLETFEPPKDSTIAILEFAFTCDDPLAYTIILVSANQNCINKPTTIPINNEGNYKARPIWIITFNQAQTHIALYNDDGTERIDVTREFDIGDKLKIDTKDEIIYYNDGPGYVEDWEGVGSGGAGGADFVRLKVGAKNYYVTTINGSLNVNVAWEFHKTWL